MKYFYQSIGYLIVGFVLFYLSGVLVGYYVCNFQVLVFFPILFIFIPIQFIRLGKRAYKENIKLGGDFFIALGILGIPLLIFIQFILLAGLGFSCPG